MRFGSVSQSETSLTSDRGIGKSRRKPRRLTNMSLQELFYVVDCFEIWSHSTGRHSLATNRTEFRPADGEDVGPRGDASVHVHFRVLD
jgi:hypothetical protein